MAVVFKRVLAKANSR